MGFPHRKSKRQRSRAAAPFKSAAQPGDQGDAGLCFGLFPRIPSARAPFRNKAQRIIDRGGPNSLKEFLVLFPDACPSCGGCRLRKVVTCECGGVWYKYVCEHCGSIVRRHCYATSSYPDGLYVCFVEARRKIKREGKFIEVNSPYLTEEEAATLPKFLTR